MSATQQILLASGSAGVAPPVGLNDGDPVSSWADSSTGGHTATQTGSARPIFKTNIVNGKPVVRFTAAGLSSLNLASQVSSASPWTIFSVFKPTTTSVRILSLAASSNFVPVGPFGSNDGSVFVGNRNGYANIGLGGIGEWRTAFHVYTAYGSLVDSGTGLLYDGVSVPTGFGALPNTGNFDTIGANPFSPGYYSDGDLAEIIVYSTSLSATDHANVEKYLGTKYAITVAGGTAVDPSTVTGLVGWWKADSLLPPVAALADGDPVSTWRDSSVIGNNATMTGTNRPTFKTAIVNGKPVVRFTSAGQSKLNLTTSITGAFPWFVFVVMKQATGASRIDSLDGNDTSGVPFGMTVVSGGGTYCYGRAGYANGSPAITTAWHILNGICAGVALANYFVLVDGLNITGGSAISVNTGSFTTIGYDSVTPTYCDGDIAEILIYNVSLGGDNMPTGNFDRNNIEKYLGTKYGISVPGGTAVQPDTVAGLVGWWKADSLL